MGRRRPLNIGTKVNPVSRVVLFSLRPLLASPPAPPLPLRCPNSRFEDTIATGSDVAAAVAFTSVGTGDTLEAQPRGGCNNG